MINSIETVNDVKHFFADLASASICIHPDDDFRNLIAVETGLATYSTDVANMYNELMRKCFEICEKADVDVYNLMREIYLIESNLYSLIPL